MNPLLFMRVESPSQIYNLNPFFFFYLWISGLDLWTCSKIGSGSWRLLHWVVSIFKFEVDRVDRVGPIMNPNCQVQQHRR